MSYEGRSPFKDVIRSVVVGATMVSPSLLQACASAPPGDKPIDVPQPPVNTNTVATSEPPATGDPMASASAPPNEVVRPRTDPTTPINLPTRGFSGGRRRG